MNISSQTLHGTIAINFDTLILLRSLKSSVGIIGNEFHKFISDAVGFFVKHVETGMCIHDTKIIHSESPIWGNVSFVELTNDCLDPAAQFRFRDNGAMLNLERQGCVAALSKILKDFVLDMLFIYVDAVSLNRSACAQRPEKEIYRALTQTSEGALSVNFSRYNASLKEYEPFEISCAVPKRDERFTKYYGIDLFVGLTRTCDDASGKRFIFGKLFVIEVCFTELVASHPLPKTPMYYLVFCGWA